MKKKIIAIVMLLIMVLSLAACSGDANGSEQRIADLENEIAILSGTVTEKDSEIAALSGTIAEKESEIAALLGAIAEKDGEMVVHLSKIAEIEKEIKNLEDKLEELTNIVGVYEIEATDMVGDISYQWGPYMEPTLGYPIGLTRPDENAVFECSVKTGELSIWHQLVDLDDSPRKVIFSYDTDIHWFPYDETHVMPLGHMQREYIDIIVKMDGSIIGYAVVYIYELHPEYKTGSYKAKLVASVNFPQIFGEYQNVSEEYVTNAIAKVKENHNEYKTEAKTEIELYAQEIGNGGIYGEKNYTEENWEIICGIVAEGKAAVDAAVYERDVDDAVAAAKESIDAVEQKDIAKAKENHKEILI